MSASFTYLLACGLQIDAALYGSMGPSLASSRASSVSNLIKTASQASLPVVDLNPDPPAVPQPVTSPVEVTVVKPGQGTGDGDRKGTESETGKKVEKAEADETGIVIVAKDGGVDNLAVEVDDAGLETVKPPPPVGDNPQDYMDVRL